MPMMFGGSSVMRAQEGGSAMMTKGGSAMRAQAESSQIMAKSNTKVTTKIIRPMAPQIVGPPIGNYAMVPVEDSGEMQEEIVEQQQAAEMALEMEKDQEKKLVERDNFWGLKIDEKNRELALLQSRVAILAVYKNSNFDVSHLPELAGLKVQIEDLELKIKTTMADKATSDSTLKEMEMLWAAKVEAVKQLEMQLEETSQELFRVSEELESSRRCKHRIVKSEGALLDERVKVELKQQQSHISEQAAKILAMEADFEGARVEVERLRGIVSAQSFQLSQQSKLYAELGVELRASKEKQEVHSFIIDSGVIERSPASAVEMEGSIEERVKERVEESIEKIVTEKTEHYVSMTKEIEVKHSEVTARLNAVQAEKDKLEKQLSEERGQRHRFEVQWKEEREEFRLASARMESELLVLQTRVLEDTGAVLRQQVAAKDGEIKLLLSKVKTLEEKDARAQELLASFKVEADTMYVTESQSSPSIPEPARLEKFTCRSPRQQTVTCTIVDKN